MNFDYSLENRLKTENPELSLRYTQCIPVFDMMLRKFFGHFPTFTDHTLFHSLTVINISNYLLQEHVSELNADEIYIYLLATGLHDVGMGVSVGDYDAFMTELGAFDDPKNEDLTKPFLIRKYHNELSGKFVLKYYEVLDIPDERYAFAVAEVCRAHRKTNLYDLEQFPQSYELASGQKVNIARLGALLRIADELDIASDRNPDMLFDLDKMENATERNLREFNRHKAIKSVEFGDDVITAHVKTEDDFLKEAVLECVEEVREKLDYCSAVMNERGGNLLSYDRVEIDWQ